MLEIPGAENWRKIVSRGKYPLLFIWELNQGLLNSHLITGFEKEKLTYYCRIRGGSYLYEPEAQAFTKAIRGVLQASPQKTLDWIKEYYKVSAEFFNWLKEIDLAYKGKKLDKLALKKLYKDYTNRTMLAWQWGYLPFLIDKAIEEELYELFRGLSIPEEKVPSLTKLLSASTKMTLHSQEQAELKKLARKVKASGLEKHRDNIKEHVNKWGWKNSWVYIDSPVDNKMIEKEILDLLEREPSLKATADLKKKELAEREKFLKTTSHEKLNQLAEVLAEYNFWHSHKIEEMTQIVYFFKPYLQSLAKVFNLSYEQLLELSPEEIEREEINITKLNERIGDSGVLMIDGKITLLAGKQIEKIKQKIETPANAATEFKGFVAYPGKVTGRVKITPAGEIDLRKIEFTPGDILVASMTTTNMVSLVRQALAVVTDEGGLLCHAAIISREMKKPCIIGTKIATKVLKDGDMIEVDANKGIVRKIK